MKKSFLVFSTVFVLLLQACGAPPAATEAPSVAISETSTEAPIAAPATEITAEPIVHTTIPSEGTEIRANAHDNEESTTSGNKDVVFGDDFQSNRFERPFTANDMNYLPDLDIVDFSITSDDDFFYIRIILAGVDPATQSLSGSYGVEFDKNSDGRAEIILITKPPYGTEFTASNVYLFFDGNADIGGERAARPDEASGNGYELVLFDLTHNTHPQDTDLAWVRFVNEGKSSIEIAYKKWLFKDGNENFMWSVFASDTTLNPLLFNFHDTITEANAGSPTKSNPNYPITGLAAMDNTCRVPFGFQATGNEPLGCSVNTSFVEAGGEPTEFCNQFPTACERQPNPPPAINIIQGFIEVCQKVGCEEQLQSPSTTDK